MLQNESKLFKSSKNNLKACLLFLTPLFVSSSIFSGCASLGNPNGGEKDLAPPVVLSSSPENKSIDVRAKKIVFSFDELINVKNPEDQIIISPAIENMEFKLKGKKLEVVSKDSLLSNTTYSINLNSAVVDITEENKIEPYQFIFSTGGVIDSLKLSGTILDAQTKDPLLGFCVALFPDSIPYDSIPYRKASVYTFSNAKGEYIFYGLKKQNYRLFAFKDANKNKQLDIGSEMLASSFEPLRLEKDSQLHDLMAFDELPEKIKVKDQKLEGDKGLIILNKAYQKTGVVPLDTHAVIYRINTRADSISIYTQQIIQDTLKLAILSNSLPFDTLVIRQKKAKADSTAAFISPLKSNSINPGTYPLLIEAGFPIRSLLKDSIILYEDSLPVNAKLDTSFSKLSISYTWKEGKRYRLSMKKGAVTLYNNGFNSSKTISFTVELAENLGNLILQVKNKENQNLLVQLLTEKKEVIAEQKTRISETLSFNSLKAGKYLLRYILDENKNGRWDTGSFKDKRLPEPINYYKDVLNIRANWELELDLPIVP